MAVKGKLVPLSIYELVEEKELATEEQKEFCAKYTTALNHLLDSNIDQSYRLFEELIEKFPNDKPTTMLHARLKRLYNNRGSEDGKWPGFEVYYEK